LLSACNQILETETIENQLDENQCRVTGGKPTTIGDKIQPSINWKITFPCATMPRVLFRYITDLPSSVKVHIGCVISYVVSVCLIGRNAPYKLHIHMASLLCEFSYVSSNYMIVEIFSYKYHNHMASRLCEFSYVLSEYLNG
jgi:hypothetical protein